MKTAAIVLSGLGLFAATYAAGPAMAADHAPATHTSRAAAGTLWQPTNSGPNNGPEWQWELDHPLRVGNAADMGTGATNAAGTVAANPTVFDIDGIDNPASTVTALHTWAPTSSATSRSARRATTTRPPTRASPSATTSSSRRPETSGAR